MSPSVDRPAPIDVALSLARTISVDRVVQEVANRVRQLTSCDGIAVALSDDDGTPQLVHHAGLEPGSEPLETELARGWSEAMRRSRPVRAQTARGIEITAPIAGSDGAIGAITIATERGNALTAADDTERTLETIATLAGASIERARAVRRLEHRSRIDAIAEVAAGIAHELRNPLFGISSAAQLLRFRVKDDPVVEKNVGRILREVERLNGMVTSLLEYGRPAPLKLGNDDPDAAWDKVLEEQRGLLESKALGIRRQRSATKASCSIDREQIAHVWVHLLTNAVQASPEGTDLSLSSDLLSNGSWKCRLQNEGPPIPPDALPRAFELFFSTRPGGTGLGLALCQRIVEEHGGSIDLQSSAGSGTAVTVVLPGAAN